MDRFLAGVSSLSQFHTFFDTKHSSLSVTLLSDGILYCKRSIYQVKRRNMSSTSADVSTAASSPASSAGEPPKPAVLLIGGVTHVKKEWEECSSFAELKVRFSLTDERAIH